MSFRSRLRDWLSFDMSIASPQFADVLHFGMGPAGVYGAYTALENPAFNRAVQILAGTIASLPLRTYHYDEDGDMREPASSFMDTWPAGPANRMSPFNWKEQVVMHLVTAGEVGLPHVHDVSGALIGLIPFGPQTYTPRWEGGRRIFKVTVSDGKQLDFGDGCDNAIDGRCFTQILGPSLDGLRGLSAMWLFRRNIALAHALEVAAQRSMTNGLKISGLVSAKDGTLDGDDAAAVARQIKETMAGPDHAGELVITNAQLEFHPWTQSNVDAQFNESREFGVHDVARMLGVPAHMLYSTSKEQSFASGLAEQWANFARTTLMPITSRIEEAVSPVVGPSTKFIAFDYKGLLQPTPEVETKLRLEIWDAGLMSKEEFREAEGLGPVDPNDTFNTPAPVPPSGRLPEIPQPAAPGSKGKMTNMPAMKGG